MAHPYSGGQEVVSYNLDETIHDNLGMMMTIEQAVLGGLAIAALLAASLCWLALLTGRPSVVLPPQRHRAVFWGSGFCLFAFVLLWLPQSILVSPFVSNDTLKIERVTYVLLAAFFCCPFQVYALLANMKRLTGTILPLGSCTLHAVIRDACLGCAAWLLATPVVLGIQLAVRSLSQRFGAPQAENTLIEALQQQPSTGQLWLLVAIEAAILAPIREELFFRGCLQPWLTNRPWGAELAFGLALVAPAIFSRHDANFIPIIACCGFVLMATALISLLVRDKNTSSRHRIRAVAATSLLFAVIHAASWPDPVALFGFGLVLGWLGWRTQGVIAAMVCHALFNATSLVLLRLTLTGD